MRVIVSITPIQEESYELHAYAVTSDRTLRRGESPKSVSKGRPAWTIGKRYSAGTYPRVCQPSNACSVTPRVRAIGSMTVQSGAAMIPELADKMSGCQRQGVGTHSCLPLLPWSMDTKNAKLQFNLTVQQRLRTLRELCNWKQRDLARRLGMQEKTYQRMETRAGQAVSAWIIHELRDMTGVDLMDVRTPVRVKQPIVLDLGEAPAKKPRRKRNQSAA